MMNYHFKYKMKKQATTGSLCAGISSACSGYFGVDISTGEICLIGCNGVQLQITDLLAFVIEIHIERVIDSFV